MKTITSSVAFQSPSGIVAANGYLMLTLQQNATLIGGGQIFSSIPTRIKLDATGKIPAGTQIIASDEMVTQIPYTADLQDSNMSRLDTLGTWAITGVSPIDLSLMVNTSSGVSFVGAVLLAPTGNQTILTNNLILALGDFVATVGNATIAGLVSGGRVAAGGTAASGSVTGDVTAARSATQAALFLGTDGSGQLFRNGDALSLSGTTKTHTFPANSGTIAETNFAQTWTAAQTFNANAFGLTVSKQIFTGNGTFTIPTGVTSVKVTVQAGGGGGGGASVAINGGGGGAGGVGIKWLSGLTPGNTLAVTVGGAGTAGASGGGTGGTGGVSSVASGTQTITTVTTNGGVGGQSNGAASLGGVGGAVGSGGDINYGGSGGSPAYASNVGAPGAGSIFGGGGACIGGSQPGNAATGAGSGGGGGGLGASNIGGAGAAGVVLFEWMV